MGTRRHVTTLTTSACYGRTHEYRWKCFIVDNTLWLHIRQTPAFLHDHNPSENTLLL